MAASQTIASEQIHAAIARLGEAISARHGATDRLLFLGIANGGIELARRIATAAHARSGTIDISFHRDDIGRQPIPKEFAPTQIPAEVDGAAVILVDDVLFTGRTVKAALDELFDHGRPAKVELAVLVDRGGRLMPVAADYVGFDLAAAPRETIVVALDPTNPRRDSIRIESPSSSSAAAATKSRIESRKSKIP